MDFMRQTQIFNPDEQKNRIIVVGAGSTGSFITLNLAKLGFKDILVYDFDKVEKHNIPNQFFRMSDVGKFKVDALKEIIVDFTGTKIKAINQKLEKDDMLDLELDTIVIFCVDSMKARKEIYENLKEFPVKLIDTRMGGVGYQIYSLNLEDEEDKEFYDKTLNYDVMETPCGEKSVIFTILSIASETCNIAKKIDKGEQYPQKLKRHLSTYRILTKIK